MILCCEKIVEYLTQANKTGYFTFTALARKPGYSQAYETKQLLVKGFGEIAVHAQTKSGEPIEGAGVNFNGSNIGFTNAQGVFAFTAGEGTHNIEVCANGSCMSKRTQLSHEGDVDELVFEFGGAGLQVNIVGPEGYPIANVLVSLDGEYKSLSNPFGIVYIKEVSYGTHLLRFDLNVGDPEYASIYYAIKQVVVDERNEVVNAIIVVSESGMNVNNTDSNILVATQSDGNFSAQFAFIPVALQVLNVASLTWSASDWCNCVYETGGGFFEGLGECTEVVAGCTGDIRECLDRIYSETGTTVEDCAFEDAVLVFDVGTTIIPVFGIVGDVGIVAAKGVRLLTGAKRVKQIKDTANAVEYSADGIKLFAKWTGESALDAGKWAKRAYAGKYLLSELASEGAEVVGKYGDDTAKATLLNNGSKLVSAELLESSLEGLVKLEKKEGLEGVGRLTKEITTARGADQLRGALTEAHHAAVLLDKGFDLKKVSLPTYNIFGRSLQLDGLGLNVGKYFAHETKSIIKETLLKTELNGWLTKNISNKIRDLDYFKKNKDVLIDATARTDIGNIQQYVFSFAKETLDTYIPSKGKLFSELVEEAITESAKGKSFSVVLQEI